MDPTLQRKLNGYTRPARKDADGTRRCRWCEGPVKPPRRTFCGDDCVHEFKLRTNPGYLREQVWKRDRGICALCGCDTEELRAKLKALREFDRSAYRTRIAACGIPENRVWSSLWDADHDPPVSEGGGQCSLEGVRTLCIPCHHDATAALAARRARRRRDAKL